MDQAVREQIHEEVEKDKCTGTELCSKQKITCGISGLVMSGERSRNRNDHSRNGRLRRLMLGRVNVGSRVGRRRGRWSGSGHAFYCARYIFFG